MLTSFVLSIVSLLFCLIPWTALWLVDANTRGLDGGIAISRQLGWWARLLVAVWSSEDKHLWHMVAAQTVVKYSYTYIISNNEIMDWVILVFAYYLMGLVCSQYCLCLLIASRPTLQFHQSTRDIFGILDTSELYWVIVILSYTEICGHFPIVLLQR